MTAGYSGTPQGGHGDGHRDDDLLEAAVFVDDDLWSTGAAARSAPAGRTGWINAMAVVANSKPASVDHEGEMRV